jgi:hypothetical protein
MVVENRKGSLYRVQLTPVSGESCIVSVDEKFINLSSFNDDMTHKRGKRGDLDIMKVYSTGSQSQLLQRLPDDARLIWKREKSFQEVCAASGLKVGDKVKVVRRMERGDNGWQNSFCSYCEDRLADGQIGTIIEISRLYDTGIVVRFGAGYYSENRRFHPDSLKKYVPETVIIGGRKFVEVVD